MESGSTATPKNENCDSPSKTLNPGNEPVYCFVTKTGSCKFRRHIPSTDLIYRPDFLFETIAQLIAY